MKKVCSVWLVPVEDQEKELSVTIQYLAKTYGSHPFVPHLTIYHIDEPIDVDRMIKVIGAIFASVKPFKIMKSNINYSNIFTKTLYVSFKANKELERLNAMVRGKLSDYSPYIVSPHMSLLYKKNMSEADKVKEAGKIKVPDSITFNRIRLITASQPIKIEEDILDWAETYELKFK